MATSGTATIDFGSAPGTNQVTVSVTGQTGILTTHRAESWMMGRSTATHNVYEHTFVPIKLSCSVPTAGTGFTITATTDLRLTGTFQVEWVWG